MEKDIAIREVSKLLIDAKNLIKKAAEIAAEHPEIEIPWEWENVYNKYMYIYKTPQVILSPEEQYQMRFDFGDDNA